MCINKRPKVSKSVQKCLIQLPFELYSVMFSFHFSYNLKYLDFYFGSLFAVILVYKVASLESEHWMSKLLNAKLVQQITSLLNVSVLVCLYVCDISIHYGRTDKRTIS